MFDWYGVFSRMYSLDMLDIVDADGNMIKRAETRLEDAIKKGFITKEQREEILGQDDVSEVISDEISLDES